MILWIRVWFCMAAFTASLRTPYARHLRKIIVKVLTSLPIMTWNCPAWVNVLAEDRLSMAFVSADGIVWPKSASW